MHCPNVLYSPYGAYRLKAAYQRNLLLATLITTSAVAVIVSATWVHSLLREDTVELPTPPPTIIEAIVDIPPQPTIVHDVRDLEALIETTRPPAYSIPVPRPDDDVPDENVAIATREERSVLVTGGSLGTDIGSNIVVDIDESMYWPEPDSFIVREIEPSMVYRHVPQYPYLARKAGISGTVWISALVDENGNVLKAIVAKSSRNKILDESAVEAAYKNKFKPGIQNGRPIKCWVSYSVKFTLD